MTIRSKFLVIFLLTAVMPLTLTSIFTLVSARAAITKEATNNVQNINAFKESRTHLFINGYSDDVTLTATRPTLIDLVTDYQRNPSQATQQQINSYLMGVRRALEKTNSISVLDLQNRIIASTEPKLIGQIAPPQTGAVDFLLPNNDLPAVSIRQPITTNGVVVGRLEFIDQGQQLATIVQDYTGLGATGDIMFARRQADGSVTLGSSRFKASDPQQAELRQQLMAPAIVKALANHTGSSSGLVTTASAPFFYTLKYIPAYNVALITKVNASEVFRAADQLRDNILIVTLMFSLFVIMVILFFVQTITGPIIQLSVVAKRIAGGDTAQRALVLSRDEIGGLATTFNHMLEQLQEARGNLEQKVAERTQQLENTNKELESFSYSVSHDLRAPLRAIDGFSKILAEDYATKIDADGQHLLSTIIASTQQMGTLIDDLLAFSRLGRQEVKKQPVDMKKLAQEVFDELKVVNPNRSIKFVLDDLPQVPADAGLVRQVWANLLSNAIKFTRHKQPAIIEAGAKTGPHEIIYYVRDNGAGFDMTFVDKLFGVFQRLHDQKDFEGTGVGLAIIKRIVTRHGGRVWAEGKVGEGAMISFTLPRTDDHKNHQKET
ncbi:MAG TPA: ATP-binding protein [Candidatus Saccharimonadia bacterium]|nr:ATP-binding protein [Candidatus Saccharimonadia bacterium]